ncbi:type I-C CRISPR-associated protein Cas8c/Csd1 [Paenibacillus sp. 598K]|uniref:type I-C CRISPR-associated protein Cas8c/Csd1 n=1 Tax=Paenibacillus sp. 598K TaxID=1117987 RepID=UPI000FF99A35|nr:type I-C CRISPR-associated protein Cas8c/Csd1 [Paenibacillus sp. 598K]GBF74457.1 type I-C CRISPR-associated protein Cas8c/Csd1 [Paenibacillus sp. 598K]
MSWLLNLYETYEANQDRVGIVEKKRKDQEFTLLPIAHTTQNAHIEVRVTEEGDFHSAIVLEKGRLETLIPATEDSASRAGSVNSPYPLHDKLSYVAGDYATYGRNPKKLDHHAKYIEALKAWADSPHNHPKVQSIYRYLSRGTLIRDLTAEPRPILHLDNDGKLIEKWEKAHEESKGAKPELFSIVTGPQEDAFIRFTVYSPGVYTDVWRDTEVYDSFIRYYGTTLCEEDLCYVSGERVPTTERHARRIRHAGDNAKLISSNDSSGFTYRGRFLTAGEAASMGYEVSQKAHNALKWLINRQGKVIDQRVFLVWGNKETAQQDLMEDIFGLAPSEANQPERISWTFPEFAKAFGLALGGYKHRLDESQLKDDKVNILVLDSATTGRLAVLYYRSLFKDTYVERLAEWHASCVWRHRYRKDEDGEWVEFYGAPATRDIAFAAYGPRADDKLVKGLTERMLPSIIDGRPVPLDIVKSAMARASNPVGMEGWEWEKTLSIACALINQKERKPVALDTETNDRDYLFGRLLAVADVLETRGMTGEKRSSNAIRYMNEFSRHPARTWLTIQRALQPYQARLGPEGIYWNKIIDEIGSRIPIDKFNNHPLTGVYLLGFYSQRHELYQKKAQESIDAEDTEASQS